MTRLAGEFQTDLALPDALAACADAVDSLGWQIDSLDGDRVVSVAGADSVNGAARVEIKLAKAAKGTDLRIIGTDTEENPLGKEELVDVLDRARDAIGAHIQQEEDEAGERAADGESDGERSEELAPAGWYPNPDGGDGERYWDGEEWTDEIRGHEEEAPQPKASIDREPEARRRQARESDRPQSSGWWRRNRQTVLIGALALCAGAAIGAAASPSDTTVKRAKVKTRTTQGAVRTTTQQRTVTETRTQTVKRRPGSAASAGSAAAAPSGGSRASSAACDPSYAPVCIDPNAGDYDCTNGGGDGPRYVSGPLTVVGDDHYELDEPDNDGVACESG